MKCKQCNKDIAGKAQTCSPKCRVAYNRKCNTTVTKCNKPVTECLTMIISQQQFDHWTALANGKAIREFLDDAVRAYEYMNTQYSTQTKAIPSHTISYDSPIEDSDVTPTTEDIDSTATNKQEIPMNKPLKVIKNATEARNAANTLHKIRTGGKWSNLNKEYK